MTGPTHFTAPWSTTLKVLSTIVTVIVLFASGAAAAATPEPGWRIALSLLPAAAVALALFFRVRGYEVRPGQLEILRGGWRTRISLAGLRGLTSGAELLRGSIRLMGNGGFYSFTGLYWNRRLGRYRLFTNDAHLSVGLDLAGRWVVVGPGDVEGFVAAVRRAVPAPLTPGSAAAAGAGGASDDRRADASASRHG